jgi:hypothetical protein
MWQVRRCSYPCLSLPICDLLIRRPTRGDLSFRRFSQRRRPGRYRSARSVGIFIRVRRSLDGLFQAALTPIGAIIRDPASSGTKTVPASRRGPLVERAPGKQSEYGKAAGWCCLFVFARVSCRAPGTTRIDYSGSPGAVRRRDRSIGRPAARPGDDDPSPGQPCRVTCWPVDANSFDPRDGEPSLSSDNSAANAPLGSVSNRILNLRFLN